MGRKPSVNLNLPAHMRARRQKSGTIDYYYDTGERPRREIPLGADYVLAVQKWSALQMAPAPVAMTVGWAIGKYLESADFAALSCGTQGDYRFALDKLAAAFGDAPLDQVRPSHVVSYVEMRSRQSAHRAQRERALLSTLYRWAMARDWCIRNPVAPVRGKRLPGRRGVLITDAMLESLYAHAPQDLRDALDLAYYIGQRPADILRLSETDVREGLIEFRQGKTRRPMRIAVTGGLAALLDRIAARKAQYPVRALALLVDERGRPMTKAKLRARFEAARAAAGIQGEDFQFRDMRRKAGTDLRDQAGRDAAQALLGHATGEMTEHYTGGRGKICSAIPSERPGKSRAS